MFVGGKKIASQKFDFLSPAIKSQSLSRPFATRNKKPKSVKVKKQKLLKDSFTPNVESENVIINFEENEKDNTKLLFIGLDINNHTTGYSIANDEGKIIQCGLFSYAKLPKTNLFEKILFIKDKLHSIKLQFNGENNNENYKWVVGLKSTPKHFGKISPSVITTSIQMSGIISYECYQLFDNIMYTSMSSVYSLFGLKRKQVKVKSTRRKKVSKIEEDDVGDQEDDYKEKTDTVSPKEQSFVFARDNLLPKFAWKLKNSGKYCDSNYEISESSILSLFALNNYKKEMEFRKVYLSQYLPFHSSIFENVRLKIIKNKKSTSGKVTKKQYQKIDGHIKMVFFDSVLSSIPKYSPNNQLSLPLSFES